MEKRWDMGHGVAFQPRPRGVPGFLLVCVLALAACTGGVQKPDGGADSGIEDAGATDSGQTDSGMDDGGDAGASDAGDAGNTGDGGQTTDGGRDGGGLHVPVSLSITPNAPTLFVNGSLQLKSELTYSDDTVETVTTETVWTTSNSRIVGVNQGLLKAHAVGTVTITGVDHNLSATVTVTVQSPPLSSITVAPTTASVALGLTRQFTATGHFQDGSTSDITTGATWTSDDDGKATVAAGLVTGVALGSATISAAIGSLSGSATVTLTPAVLKRIDITPANPSVPQGVTIPLTATGVYSDGTTANLTTLAAWNSSNPGAATVSSDGQVTGVVQGSAVITATYTGVTGNTAVGIGPAILRSLEITPTDPSFVLGNSLRLFAKGNYSDSSTADLTTRVTWSSSDENIARVSQGALVGIAAGEADISVSLNNVSATVHLTVKPPRPVAVRVTADRNTFPLGLSAQVSASATFSDGSESDVSSLVAWSSDNRAIAEVSPTGRVTGVASGMTAISATLEGIKGTQNITVAPHALSGLSVSPTSADLPIGTVQPLQMAATATYTDSATLTVTSSATWSSSNPSIATVSSAGIVTARALGTVTIQATYGGLIAPATINAKPVALLSILVSEPSLQLPTGYSQSLTATGSFTDTTRRTITNEVTWTSSDPSVATIDANGVVSTVSAGTVTLTATKGSIFGSVTLTVLPHTLVSITVTVNANPPVTALPQGTSLQLHAQGVYADNLSEDLTSQVLWAPDNASRASVSASGSVTSLNPGDVTISATSGTVVGELLLHMTPAEIVSLDLTSTGTSMPLGLGTTFQALVTMTNGDIIDVTDTAQWSSSRTEIATINSGLVASAAIGASIITATYSGHAASATITVTAKELVSVKITADPGDTLPIGLTTQLTATGTYTDSSKANLTDQVVWTLSDPAPATIDTHGLVSAVAVGPTTATATIGAIFDSHLITVNPAALLSIDLAPGAPVLDLGTTLSFTALGRYTGQTTRDLTTEVSWTSSDESVATISPAGLVTSIGQGLFNVTATLGSVSSTVVGKVGPPAVTTITLSPLNPSMALGLTVQMKAEGSFTDNVDRDITSQVTWLTDDSSIAWVSATGIVQSTGVGVTTLRATMNGRTALTDVTVTPEELVPPLVINPTDTSTPKGRPVTFTVTGNFTNATQRNLTSLMDWSSSDEAVVALSPSEPGVAQSLAEGSVTVTATSPDYGTVGTSLTVTHRELLTIAITSSTLRMAKGLSTQLTATGTYTDATEDITGLVAWSSSNPSVATVTPGGLVQGAAKGTATMTASLEGVQKTVVITIDDKAPVSMTISPQDQSVPKGTPVQLTVIATYTDATTDNVTSGVSWTWTNTPVVTISAGQVQTKAEGSTTITATLSGISISTTLTILPHALTSIAISPSAPSAPLGRPISLTATGTYTDTLTGNLTSTATWSSSDESIAVVFGGAVTTVAKGSCTITATKDGISTSVPLQVLDPVLEGLAVSPTSKSIALGLSYSIVATGHYSDGGDRDVTSQATWTSTAPAVATVSGGTVQTKQTGSSTIRATLSGFQASSSLTVTAKDLVSIAITGTMAVPAGDPSQLTATATFTNGDTSNVTTQAQWSTSNATLAGVSAGLVSTHVAGTVTIGATYTYTTGKNATASTPFTVQAAVLRGLSVTPYDTSNLPLLPGETVQMVATGTYSDGTTKDLSRAVTWSSDANLATVNSTGLVTGQGEGTANISASSNNISDSYAVMVLKFVGISVNPQRPSINMFDTLTTLKATANYADPNDPFEITQKTVDVTSTAFWYSDNTGIARFTGVGTNLYGADAGTTSVHADWNSLEGTATVSVAGPQTITLGPKVSYSGVHIPVGETLSFSAKGNFPGGITKDITSSATWSTPNSYCFTVLGGVVSGKHACSGFIAVTASLGGISGTFNVIIDTVVALGLSDSSFTLSKGQAKPMGVTIGYSDTTFNGADDGLPFVKWVSSDTSVATVNSNGVIQMRDLGTAVVTASMKSDGSHPASVNVEVIP